MPVNYVMEIEEQSVSDYSVIKLFQPTQTNPEPHAIGVQKEKSLRPRSWGKLSS